jgi:hypothetical protein
MAKTPTRSRDLCLEFIILDEQLSHLARPHESTIPSRPGLPDPDVHDRRAYMPEEQMDV